MRQLVTVLGATGSIGKSTLDVLKRHSDQFQVFAITANRQVDVMLKQCLEFQPKYAVMVDESSAKLLREQLKHNASSVEVLSGSQALVDVAKADEVDQVMAAIVGAAGLLPTLAAAQAGKRVLLANKEALVMSGQLFMNAVRDNQAQLLPIDSEHNAIFQSLPLGYGQDTNYKQQISKVLLTASGGPFRGWSVEQLNTVTPAQAVKHPNWSMGQKISVDSASLMNKGLELIEACWLFDLKPSEIEVVVHPESIIHSLVQYIDGSVICQMGNPDMRTPIAYGLSWPERIQSGVEPLNLFEVAQLNFEAPNHQVFPVLNLASQAFEAGGTAPAILNAANEVAVAGFLREQIPFTSISYLIEEALNACTVESASNLDIVLQADSWARQFVEGRIGL
ncbi:1-deoxy-D-xylulose-5-phosphate reductoisomerase [Oceaniserpentilla sp. 4NH20-0058]|uniref:1-deoxy-D-xylulose-5-phosphate reductoisomerase n=1 Tax=Oceaniserpentilla sp. 4NH20-0058 TaxID=3127660 RepID=UPI003103902F